MTNPSKRRGDSAELEAARILEQHLGWTRVITEKINVTDSGCWEYMGARTGSNYGNIRIGGRAGFNMPVHRLAWTVTHGPIPDGAVICHKCDNPPCCNPDHLFVGTHADNVRDKIRKGRHWAARDKTAKLTRADVVAIRDARARGEKLEDLAQQYGVVIATISRAANRVCWSDVT